MTKKFKVVGNSRYNHNFEIGTIVEYVRTYPDGVLCVIGKLKYSEGRYPQDVSPVDLEEVKGD